VALLEHKDKSGSYDSRGESLGALPHILKSQWELCHTSNMCCAHPLETMPLEKIDGKFQWQRSSKHKASWAG